MNCQSLNAHFDEFRQFFIKSDYHVICLSETWLRPGVFVSDAMMCLLGYTFFRINREGRHGGGMAFYIRNTLNASILTRSEEKYCSKLEFIVAEVFSVGVSKLLNVVHRPPSEILVSFS